MMPVLDIVGLNVRFATPEGEVAAVTDLSLQVRPGEVLGMVGESGSGKTQAMMAVMGLLAGNGRADGVAAFAGQNLIGLAAAGLNRLRGGRVAMIFQDPMTALNPYLSISRQMTEVLQVHRGLDARAARAGALAMLDRVRIPDARSRLDLYPHEFSGGMRQRVMIAMALLCGPELIIADEPTTALDVTVQAQILDLLADIRRDTGAAILLITHDLGVIARIADRVLVMYAGRAVETGNVFDLFAAPRHPYTQGLLAAMPRASGSAGPLSTIPGQPPNMQRLAAGCAFAPRCPVADGRCAALPPTVVLGPERSAACFRVAA